MELEITLPETVPAMTLPKVAFFPHALMPLHIFEPRYRAMLRDVLASNRLFALAGLNEALDGQPGQFEPLHRVASVGIIRACQKNGNGTSNLLLQGLCRVEIMEIMSEEPYRRLRVRALSSQPPADPDDATRLRQEITRLLGLKHKLGAPTLAEFTGFLRGVEDTETFVDLAAFTLCDDSQFKQKLLETLDVGRRLSLFARRLRAEVEALRLRRRLQGGLEDGHISDN